MAQHPSALSGELASAHNLAELLAAHTGSQQPALTWAGGGLTYGQLVALSAAARSWLQGQSVGQGDRVALALPNVPAMVALYYATLSLGAVAVPMHPLLAAREVAFQVQDAGACLLVAGAGTRVGDDLPELSALLEGGTSLELLALDEDFGVQEAADGQDGEKLAGVRLEVEAVGQHDPAVLLYTSGTTGVPKGATLTHANMLSNARTCQGVFGFAAADVIFGGLPLFHSFGQTVSMNAVFAAGATIALLPRFTPQAAAQLCAVAGVTVLAAVPTMYSAVASYLATDAALAQQLRGQIRCGISGGSALPASVHAQLDQLLNCPVYEGYGLSETAPVVSFNQADFGLVIGSVGRPIPGVAVKVVDRAGEEVSPGERGELWVSGPNVMSGYWQNPAATAAVMHQGWLATGDIARLDDEGNIFIVDRLKDMILRKGFSVYPREVEDVLYTHPGVKLAAVVGQPAPEVGEEIVAVIVSAGELNADEQAQLVASLDATARAQLAAYKYPRRYLLRTELPLGPTGKILKRVLVEDLQAES